MFNRNANAPEAAREFSKIVYKILCQVGWLKIGLRSLKTAISNIASTVHTNEETRNDNKDIFQTRRKLTKIMEFSFSAIKCHIQEMKKVQKLGACAPQPLNGNY